MKVDYQKTIIYKLCCNDINITDIYVGHTTNFKQRNQGHKKCCNNPNSKSYNVYKYQFIRDNGGYENWKMIKLYDYPCNSKRDAEAEEDKTMRELNSKLNSHRSFTTLEEKKEQHKKGNKQFFENNKNEILEHQKKYRENNKDIINEKRKIYYQTNKDILNEKRKVKVICTFCNCQLNKSSLKKHQKSMKCMKFQECMILD